MSQIGSKRSSGPDSCRPAPRVFADLLGGALRCMAEFGKESDRLLQRVTRLAEKSMQHLTNSAPDTVYDQVSEPLELAVRSRKQPTNRLIADLTVQFLEQNQINAMNSLTICRM